LHLDDAELKGVVDTLVADGRLVRHGRRLIPPDGKPELDPEMRQRIDRLLAGLQAAGLAPPPVEALAARLGIPAGVIAELRASGSLVHLAPGIDYPAGLWRSVEEELARLAASGPLTVRRVRDALRATRRHAEAILARRRGDRAKRRARHDSQPVR
jgi:hypothetical protein